MRKVIAIVALCYLAAAVAALGFLSNWFREDLSFGGSVIVTPLVLSGLVVFIVAIFAFWQRSQLLATALVVIAVGSTVYIANLHRDTFGSWLPSLTPDDVETSGIAVLNAHGAVVRYRLELHNPGTVSHREYLVVNLGGRDRPIRLPLFDDARSGHISAKTPNDWIVLRPTKNADIYEAEIGRLLLVQKSFRVNVQTGRASAK